MGKNLKSFLLFCCVTLTFSFLLVQDNNAPEVEIISPNGNVNLKWNTLVPYSISIVDKEDGNSEYDEINSNEVILTVTYFSDYSEVEQYIDETVSSRSEALSLMASSNCFTCHKAKNKLIGPSFEEIAMKYLPTQENKDYLTQKIIQGSQGIWSDEIMPAQPELEKEKIKQMLDWIFKNAQDPDFTFYTGAEGAFKTKKQGKNDSEKAAYVLHAQYADHGFKDYSEKSKKGEHTIILQIE